MKIFVKRSRAIATAVCAVAVGVMFERRPRDMADKTCLLACAVCVSRLLSVFQVPSNLLWGGRGMCVAC